MTQPAWPFPTQESIQEAEAFRQIFWDLKHKSKLCSPRQLKVLELEHYTYELPPYARFCTFEARKLKLNYIKNEFLWYLRGDRYDTSIGKHGAMWNKLINADGGINSNYGQYIFQGWKQFDTVVAELLNDQDSRRASMVILLPEHLRAGMMGETKDVPCTYAISFRIREGKLNMSVHMRSQDAIFGMGNDAPTFSFIHEMLYQVIKPAYRDLELGWYRHTCDSLHVYERHFEMLDQLVAGDVHHPVACPRISDTHEVLALRQMCRGDYKEVGSITNQLLLEKMSGDGFKFMKWLYTKEEE